MTSATVSHARMQDARVGRSTLESLAGFGTRIGLIFLVLYCVRRGFPLYQDWTHLTSAESAAEWWFGRDLLGLGYSYGNWVSTGYKLCVGMIGGLIWMLADRTKRHEAVLRESFFVFLRFVLASEMFGYGFEKVFPVQMPPPDPVHWIKPFGELFPSDFLWTWMGISQGYEMFAGWSEVIAGVLLLFRRTSTLGALLSIGTMANVAGLNFGFGGDMASSIDSGWAPGEFMVMAIVLALRDWRRIANVLVLHRPTNALRGRAPVWPDTPGRRRLELAAKATLVALMLYGSAGDDLDGLIDLNHPCPLRGAYRVKEYSKDGRAILTAQEAPKRWRLVAIDNYCYALAVRRIDDSPTNFAFHLVVPISVATFYKWRRGQQQAISAPSGTFMIEKPWSMEPGFTPGPPVPVKYVRKDDTLELDGNFAGENVHVLLERIPNGKFALYNPSWR